MISMFHTASKENLHSHTDSDCGTSFRKALTNQLITANGFQALHACTKCTDTWNYKSFRFKGLLVVRGEYNFFSCALECPKS